MNVDGGLGSDVGWCVVLGVGIVVVYDIYIGVGDEFGKVFEL